MARLVLWARVKALGFRTSGRTITLASPHAYRRGETCYKVRENQEIERERESVEVEDASERQTPEKCVCVYAFTCICMYMYISISFSYSLRFSILLAHRHGIERDVIDRTFHRASRAVRTPSRAIAKEFLECSSVSAETMLSETIRSHE